MKNYYLFLGAAGLIWFAADFPARAAETPGNDPTAPAESKPPATVGKTKKDRPITVTFESPSRQTTISTSAGSEAVINLALSPVTVAASEKLEKPEKPEKAEKPDRPEKLEKSERPEKLDKAEKAERAEAVANRAEEIVRSSRKRSADSSRLTALMKRSIRPEGVLIVHTAKPAAARDAEIEEDMRIMAHLLGKRLDQTGEEGERKVMGIPVAFSKSFSHFFLEGYGAVFTFNVPFPLAPNISEEAAAQASQAGKTDWDEIRNQLYGRRRGSGLSSERDSAPAKYDRAEIEKLQQNLLQAVTNAHHMRHLKADDKIVVILSQSSPSSDLISWQLEDVLRSGDADARVLSRQKLSSDQKTEEGSTLQITARKGDIDALMRGIITFDDFRNTTFVLAH